MLHVCANDTTKNMSTSASCAMGNGSFPGVKCGPGRAADHSSPSSTEVLEE